MFVTLLKCASNEGYGLPAHMQRTKATQSKQMMVHFRRNWPHLVCYRNLEFLIQKGILYLFRGNPSVVPHFAEIIEIVPNNPHSAQTAPHSARNNPQKQNPKYIKIQNHICGFQKVPKE